LNNEIIKQVTSSWSLFIQHQFLFKQVNCFCSHLESKFKFVLLHAVKPLDGKEILVQLQALLTTAVGGDT